MPPLRLLAILAHPDDESLGLGGTLAKYAAEGVETYLLTATRGERGWFGDPDAYPGPEELGRIRESELLEAAGALGLKGVHFLDYHDGELHRANAGQAIMQIVSYIRDLRPEVIITFDPNGAYGHPDHITICQLASSALVAAADSGYSDARNLGPHAVKKLYYMAWTREDFDVYEAAFGKLVMQIEGEMRQASGWDKWAITTRLDTSAYWETVRKAVYCHRTQLPGYDALLKLPEEYHKSLWGKQTFYRAISLVDTGPGLENDLFAGIRDS
ncbi:MAG TPA: PIG-L family deacetylase [Dehalococcoidia bacterium]|nr:PIG-L family deacetylase [Dehalococcoidia bacterium]